MESLVLNEIADNIIRKYQYIFGKNISKDNLSIEEMLEYIVRYYQDIISCMPGNVYWLAVNGSAIGCNQNVLDMFGLKSIEQFKGLTFEQMGEIGGWTAEATKSFKRDTLDVVNTGLPRLNIEEPPIPHADGRLIYFLTSRVPLYDHAKNVIGVVGISIDITELRNAQITLKNAKEEAETANQLKSDFIRNMEHDIRTPFSGIWGLTNILYEQETEPFKKELLADIKNSAKELLDYSNSILDFSKIESGTLPILEKKFKIRKLIDEIIAIEKPAVVIKKLEFHSDIDQNIPDIVIGDSFRLKRILINLISNSIKFTKEGYIKLTAKLAKKSNNRHAIIRFTIEDTGMGMPKEKQNFIYEKFVRLTPSNQGHYKGLGLGLRVVKQFMNEMGGDIELQSTVGHGTKFICTLPFKQPLINDIASDDLDD